MSTETLPQDTTHRQLAVCRTEAKFVHQMVAETNKYLYEACRQLAQLARHLPADDDAARAMVVDVLITLADDARDKIDAIDGAAKLIREEIGEEQ